MVDELVDVLQAWFTQELRQKLLVALHLYLVVVPHRISHRGSLLHEVVATLLHDAHRLPAEVAVDWELHRQQLFLRLLLLSTEHRWVGFRILLLSGRYSSSIAILALCVKIYDLLMVAGVRVFLVFCTRGWIRSVVRVKIFRFLEHRELILH